MHGVQSFRNGELQHRSPVGSQVLPANLLQCRLPTGSQLPSGTSTFSGRGASTAYGWMSASLLTSTGCRGTALSHQGLHHGLHRNLCSSTWNLFPSFTDPDVCRVLSLSCSHSSLQLQFLSHSLPLSNTLLKSVIPEAL